MWVSVIPCSVWPWWIESGCSVGLEGRCCLCRLRWGSFHIVVMWSSWSKIWSSFASLLMVVPGLLSELLSAPPFFDHWIGTLGFWSDAGLRSCRWFRSVGPLLGWSSMDVFFFSLRSLMGRLQFWRYRWGSKGVVDGFFCCLSLCYFLLA